MRLEKSVIEAFEALGLTSDAEQADAAKAYKKLALEHHPDRNHGDSTATERFQKVRHNLVKIYFSRLSTCSKMQTPRSAWHGIFARTIIENHLRASIQLTLLVSYLCPFKLSLA